MKKISLFIVGVLALLMQYSCSELDEKVYSSNLTTNFYTSAEEIEGAYMRPWSHLLFCDTYYYLKLRTLGTDMAAWTTKTSENHGYDNALWSELHKHTWGTRHGEIESSWNTVWEGIGFANAVLEGIEDKDFEEMGVSISKAEMQAQLRAYRAYMHMIGLDFWRNIPIVTKVGDPYYPETKSAQEVFEFVETEFLAVKGSLPNAFEPYAQGFFSQQSVEALLSRLYLNAKTYIGVDKYEDAIKMCDAVISSDFFELEADYLNAFSKDNNLSKENIQVLTQKGGSSMSAPLHALTCYWSNHVDAGGWNGIITQEGFYDSYSDDDVRKNQFAVGPQFYADGTPVYIEAGNPGSGQLVYSKEVTTFHSEGLFEGARCKKYEAIAGLNWNQEYDIVLIRYAEVLMNKAEAIMRQNNGQADQTAVNLVNELRGRAFGDKFEENKYTTTTLTLDELLAERGREFAYEGHRRTDLIRFGKYLQPRWEKESTSDATRILFPIPQTQRDINTNLKQNDGY
ncbi:RagB/SusD family nutrient uptake outer membrane protein [Marinifilum fragile]|uniref:RagB/SusD family nutrient uptake outer membrane protein n=1 Tax=Marinifilum fragile TaxID=570161 RepID=UPI002AAAA749|nr:RagB/SusD family nutrient uptake outer membrane protein [Marinifilum fragile]